MKPVIRLLTLACALALAACDNDGRTQDAPVDAMGMTAEEHARMLAEQEGAGEGGSVHLTPAQARAIGVTYTTVDRGRLARSIRTVGQIVPAEPSLADVTVKIDGFVERLFVDATGTAVRRGDPLLALYSPMLVSAQEELLTALRLAAAVDSTDADAVRLARSLVDAGRRRLEYWDISADDVRRLEQAGQVTKTLTIPAPADGVVLEKMVVQGQAVMPGMKLYRLADLSSVWIEGEVFEQDLAAVPVGTPVRIEVAAYPGRAFAGAVGFVYPMLNEDARTGRVRALVRNPGRLLKPGMYATLHLEAELGRDVLLVPAEAVVMTGERNLVYAVGPDGMLEPREVVLGARGDRVVEIRSGVAAGTRIVKSANFLVDAESRLGTGAAGMADMPGMIMDREKKP